MSALAFVAAAACGGSSADPKLVGAGRPANYRIVYETRTSQTPGYQVLSARRPFDVRSATFASPPVAGTPPTGGTLTNTDQLYVVRDDGPHQVSGRQPGVGTADQSLTVVMPDAVKRKLAKPLGLRTVVGRQCRDYKFVEPPAGPIKKLSGKDNDVLCIDGDGLVLREAYTYQGKLALLRTATAVAMDSSALPGELDLSKAIPLSDPNAPTAQVTPDAKSFVAPTAPAGFTATPVETFKLPDPGQAGQLLYTSVVWPFTRGPDVITVEAGQSPQLPWDTTDVSRPVTLPIGKAASVVRSDGSELRFDLGSGRWMRVRGTVPLADLENYARTLHLSS